MRMFKWGMGLAAFWVVTVSLFAQVGITQEVNFQNFLQHEPVWVRVKIHNYTGHPLPFSDSGALKGLISFEVEDNQRRVLRPFGELLLREKAFLIPPNRAHTLIVPLSSCYDLRNLGTYQVRTVIKHPLLPTAYESGTSTFTVSRGVKVFSTTAGVTGTGSGELKKIPSRDVNILSMFDGKDKAYYLNIEDKEKVYAQIRIGYELDASRPPACALDAANNIHILTPINSKLMVYFVFDIDGDRKTREVYAADAQGVLPVLQISVDGDVRCNGGRIAKRSEYVEEPNNRFRASVTPY